MEKYYDLENELYHHGTRGMKWGIRRYQNKDGTLTTAGKKRYAKEMDKLKEEQKVLKNKQRTQAKIDKLEQLRKDNENIKKGMNKPVKNDDGTITKRQASAKKLSTEELTERINRMDLEKNYKRLQTETSSVSKGKKIAYDVLEKVGKDLVEQTLEYVGGQAINKFLFKGADAVDPKNIQNRRKK